MRVCFHHCLLLLFILSSEFSILLAQDTLAMQTIDEVVFVGKRIYEPSALTITNRDFKRLAASFDDPSRILIHYPGFSNANDQANGIIYRGLPSHFSGWQLNGLDIVNPNHLSNAGTFSDRSSFSAGGVNMFSGNLINKYQYNTALSAEMNGASLAGISNIIVDSLDQSYAQLSLLGLEAGITKNFGKHHSFFGSYRYSFTGLLGELGVNFGNEKIAFSDGMLGYSFSGKKTKINLLWAKGLSSNMHSISEEDIESYKDFLLIDYNSDIDIYQLQLKQQVSKEMQVQFSVSYSDKDEVRFSRGSIDSIVTNIIDINTHDENNEDKLTLFQSLTFKKDFELGMKQIRNTYFIFNINNGSIEGYANYARRWALLPYVKKKLKLSQQFGLEIIAYGLADKSFYFTPALNVNYAINEKSLIQIKSGKSAQLLYPFHDSPYSTSLNAELNYRFTNEKFIFHTGLFYHSIKNIPASADYYSMINQLDFLNIPSSDEKEQAYSRGIFLSIEPSFKNGYWVNVNTTYFSTKFRNNGGNELADVENNYKIIANFNAGKKIQFKSSVLTIASSFHLRGGAYQYSALENILPPQFNYSLPPTLRLASYQRLDLRINYTKGNSFWSLDIQNVLNTLNDAYQYYDLEGLRTQKQLGMIPVLTYKYSF